MDPHVILNKIYIYNKSYDIWALGIALIKLFNPHEDLNFLT